jgi:riboflavin synthase
MFTGLIESEGIITRAERASGGLRLEVYAPEFGRDMAIGDSIAVDGACLTVVKFIRGAFLADVSEETASRTTLGSLKQGQKVNLERALRFSDRFGGHMVSGHIDGLGSLVMRHPAGNSTIYQFSAPPDLMEYVVAKGSIAVDGVSLTVADTRDDSFACAIIPHTEQSTTLKEKAIGSAVNLEVDMMAKYVKRFVGLYMGVDDDAPRSERRGLGDLLREFAEGR